MISGARADLENPFGAVELGGVGHGRDHERLRDGLSAADGKRHIGIGGGGGFGRNEFVARDGEHGVQDAGRADAAGADLARDHFVAGGGEVAGGCADCGIGVGAFMSIVRCSGDGPNVKVITAVRGVASWGACGFAASRA